MRYRLRTLLILLAVLPPLLAGAWFTWQAFQPSEDVLPPLYQHAKVRLWDGKTGFVSPP